MVACDAAHVAAQCVCPHVASRCFLASVSLLGDAGVLLICFTHFMNLNCKDIIHHIVVDYFFYNHMILTNLFQDHFFLASNCLFFCVCAHLSQSTFEDFFF